MIRHLEEDLGVWESVEPQLTAANELLDARERAIGRIPQEDKCQECNFSTKNATKMKGHMIRHKTYKCDQCQEVLKDQAHLNSHMQQEHRPNGHTCNICKKQFKANNSLKQHMNTQHRESIRTINPPIGHPQWSRERNTGNNLDYACNMCENGFETLKEIREHKATEHSGETFNGFKKVVKECHFYKQGRCDRNPCRFSHQQQQQQAPVCSRGQKCRFLYWGTCHFFHQGVGVQQPKQHQNSQQKNSQELNRQQQNSRLQTKKKCHFQENCWNQNCSYHHEDFSMRKEFQENY